MLQKEVLNWNEPSDPQTPLAAQHHDPTQADEPITTMMIRNIPCRCSEEDIMADIEALGFAGKYDFFYLPRDRRQKSNLGYAFINLDCPKSAVNFQAKLQGYRFAASSKSGSRKVCIVQPASVQGLENNYTHFRRTAVMRSDRAPSFFSQSSPGEKKALSASASEFTPPPSPSQHTGCPPYPAPACGPAVMQPRQIRLATELSPLLGM